MQQQFLLVGEGDRLFAAHKTEQHTQIHEANLSRNEFARETNATLTKPAPLGVRRMWLSADVALILLMGAVVLSRAANCSIPLAVAFSASSSKYPAFFCSMRTTPRNKVDCVGKASDTGGRSTISLNTNRSTQGREKHTESMSTQANGVRSAAGLFRQQAIAEQSDRARIRLRVRGGASALTTSSRYPPPPLVACAPDASHDRPSITWLGGAEQSRAEQSRAEQSRAEQSRQPSSAHCGPARRRSRQQSPPRACAAP